MVESKLAARNIKTANGSHTRLAQDKGSSYHRAGKHPSWQVRVSNSFVILSLLSCTLVAFVIGRTARRLLFINPQIQFMEETNVRFRFHDMTGSNEHDAPQRQQDQQQRRRSPRENNVMKLPNPVLKNGKLPPPTLYTSKNFDTARSAAINSRWVVTEPGTPFQIQDAILVEDGDAECAAQAGECSTCIRGKAIYEHPTEGDQDDDEEEHLPVGQHLLMDIRNVDAEFLASEERLANAMLDVVGECGLTLLSYHCHGLYPAGVSCVGVLLESHVSFHTWPAEGVITLDLFTCGPNSLLPIVPKVEELFSVPRSWATSLMDMPEAIWAYKWRGYGAEDEDTTAELTDLFTFPIGAMTEYKKEIASVYIGSDRIDIYDVLRSPYQTLESYKRLLTEKDSYEAQNADVFRPDRIVFTNGVLQSRRSSVAEYYEMLVHPAIFAHDNPKHLAVVGFGDGAILREALKHKSIQRVVLLEYDEALLNLTTAHFPEYDDCSYLKGPNKKCLQDPRVTIYYGDTLEWFEDEGSDNNINFDVIIVDDLDLVFDYEDALEVFEGLHDAMSENGVLVAAMGDAPTRESPAIDTEIAKGFSEVLVQAGFESVRDYEEGHLGYEWPWRFALAFKSYKTRAAWFRNEASMEIEIRRRIIPAQDGSLSLAFYDGAMQSSILYPPRPSEMEFCRRRNVPRECGGGSYIFDPEIPNLVLESTLEAKPDPDDSTLHVYAKADIPSPSYVGLEQAVSSLYFPPFAYQILIGAGTKYRGWSGYDILDFEARYAYVLGDHGELEAYIPSTLQLFIQRSCNGSTNFGRALTASADVANPDSTADEIMEMYTGRGDRVYNPAAERHAFFIDIAIPWRPVQKGEEILVNKLASTGLNKKATEQKSITLRGISGTSETSS